MLYTEESVRANIRNREGKRVFYLGKGDSLTSRARDWLRRERIEILSADLAKVERYCLANGAYLEEKPEHMTHLNAEILVPKTHPRIVFRGAVDTLEAELILAQLAAPSVSGKLEEILTLARKILRCDVLEEPLEDAALCGLTESEQRRRSHFPQEYYGQPHFMPEYTDGQEMLQLNKARCAAREAERLAVEAFQDREGNPTRVDILQAMNRMSSMLWILMIRLKKERGGANER
jgi:ethanolamine utilization cobalamin adenosyltransferase